MEHTITVFYGSPRRNGNSDKLADSFIKGAQTKNNIINKVIIRDKKINGCLGCEYCYEHRGVCVQKDDMQVVYKYLEVSDIIVFSTPIYYQSFPSQLKAVIDRLYVTENRELAVKNAVLLATYATKGEEMSLLTVQYFKSLINYLGWTEKGIITVDGLDEKDDIIGTQSLDLAYKLGCSIDY